MSKLLNPSVPPFLLLQNVGNNSAYTTGLLLGANQLINIKCLEQGIARLVQCLLASGVAVALIPSSPIPYLVNVLRTHQVSRK